MSALEVTFPDEWLSFSARSAAAVARPVTPGGALMHGRSPATPVRGAAPLPPPPELGIEDLAALVLPGERTDEGPVAFCGIGVVQRATGTDAELREIAERSPHPGLERDTLLVELSLGRAVRSSAFRFADELLADESAVPFTAEVRFALRLPARRIGVLHFETFSLRGFEALESLFDTIAGTARVV